jgi:hypothetical protein
MTETTEALPTTQQIGLLNLRISDMMAQLSTVIKALIEENAELRKENADLKTKQEKNSKP